jgi:hypothetical protein
MATNHEQVVKAGVSRCPSSTLTGNWTISDPHFAAIQNIISTPTFFMERAGKIKQHISVELLLNIEKIIVVTCFATHADNIAACARF